MRRVALVSNCLANQNAKVAEYEICPGAVSPVLGVLREKGFLIRQMPCPEMTFLGCGRWWQTRAQYDTPGYRRHCRMVADNIADLVQAELGEGCSDLVLLGVDGSPSSGIGITDFGPEWGGRPGPREIALVPGRGVWIEMLLEVLEARGLPRPRLIGLGTELPGFALQPELARLAAFLDAADLSEAPAGPIETGGAVANPADRGRKVLVLSAAAMDDGVLCVAAEGADWGLLQLPPDGLTPAASRQAVELVADQIEDYQRHGYLIAALAGTEVTELNAELSQRGCKVLDEIDFTAQ